MLQIKLAYGPTEGDVQPGTGLWGARKRAPFIMIPAFSSSIEARKYRGRPKLLPWCQIRSSNAMCQKRKSQLNFAKTLIYKMDGSSMPEQEYHSRPTDRATLFTGTLVSKAW